MNENTTRKNVLSGLVWKLLERGGDQVIQFVIQLLLARLLLPEDYGLIALITIFIALANVFIQTGFTTALIQAKEVDEIDYASAFYFSSFLTVLLYLLLFLAAPAIADFYEKAQLIPVVRVLALSLFCGPLNSIQYAVVSRNLEFKKFFFSSLGGTLFSGILGVYLAYKGFGVWALVAQQLSNIFIDTIVLWFTVSWRPTWAFSFERINKLLSFGWKMLSSTMLDTLYTNSYGLVIGKVISPAMLGYYNRANQFPSIIVNNVNNSLSTVLFPVMSASQEDKPRIRSMMQRSLEVSSLIIFPLMTGLIICAKPLVIVVLTEKWLASVPLIQLISLAYAFYPLHITNIVATSSLGKSELILKLEIVKRVFSLFCLFISIPFGIFVIVAFEPLISIGTFILNARPNKRLLGYGVKEQLSTISPYLVLSIMMGIIVYPLAYLPIGSLATLTLQAATGATFYIVASLMNKNNSIHYLLATAKELLWRKSMKKRPEKITTNRREYDE